ncbi:MAG: hypothetical protein EAY75_02110 [Bacteroidetes bacterium]|nr:MAG: hypothetical protein EAY75_02110 [Bacteroidota bacterium]
MWPAPSIIFNTDPGFGNGTPISIVPGAIATDVLINLNVQALPLGIHQLYLRTANAAGQWSITNRTTFFKSNLPTSNVARAEYFFNTDPGFGNGTPVNITPGAAAADVLVNLNVQALPLGINQLYLRTANAAGQWSITNRAPFVKNRQGDAITRIEYFYDTDPGFGNGIPVAINPTTQLGNYTVPINISGLAVGEHTAYLRTFSSGGWSITNTKAFTIATATAAPLINVNSVTSKVNCAWAKFRISFHATGTYTAGNRFTVQLSNADGSFASPIVIGDTLTTRSSEVFCTLPPRLPDGTNYRIRVVSSTQPVTGISGIDAITIRDRPDLGSDTTAFIVCQGETVNLLPLYATDTFATAAWNFAPAQTAPAGQYRLIVANVYGCADTAFATVRQDVNRWTGAINANWHNPGNWSSGKIPNEKTHVIVDSNTINPCQISQSDATAASVQVRNGGNVGLLNNRVLHVQARCSPLPTGP